MLAAAAVVASLAVPLSTVPAGSHPAAASPSPTAADRGTWRVTRVDNDTWRVAWRSPQRLPIAADRPRIVEGAKELGLTIVGSDGRTVEVTVRSDGAPDPADLDVVLSGDRLDVVGTDLLPAGTSPTEIPGRTLLGADPGTPGPFEVVSSDYQLQPVKIPGMRAPIEMVGHVVEPPQSAATGPRPLVLFLHGRHSYCYNPDGGDGDFDWPCRPPMEEIPSHLGYDYIQQLLASHGYATVSVRVNGINAQDWALTDGGAGARAQIVRRHLDHWVDLAAGHRVDLSRVVLVGHSRGGEGVSRASLRIPTSAPYTIAGQVLIAPTDFGTQTAAYVPTVTMLPYCDGDVIDLQGQRFTDTARDLTTDDTSLKSSVMVMGANHNFFNTEWTPGVAAAPSSDDWFGPKDAACGTATPARLTAFKQRRVGKAYVAGAVRLFTRDAEEFLPMYDGSSTKVASTGTAVVLSHAIGGGRNLRRPGIGTGLTLPDGAETQFCRGLTQNPAPHRICGRAGAYSYQTPHWPAIWESVPSRRAFEMSWTAAGQRGGMVFDSPLNLSGDRLLDLRTIVDPLTGGVQVRVRLTDADGAQAVVTPRNAGRLPVLLTGPGLSKRWAHTLRVDPSGASGVDLTRISSVELIADSARGRVWVLDVAAVPAALAPVPHKRMPVVSLDNVSVEEGDRPGTTTARVPFHVRGNLTDRASFRVIVAGERDVLDRGTFTVDLAPGQTEGSIPIGFIADKIDDFDETQTYVAAWAGRGVMPDRYLGSLTVVDDDPAPKVTISKVQKRVSEGEDATWRVTLSSRTDYSAEFYGTVVRGDVSVPRLRKSDVPARWLRRHSKDSGTGSTPLHRVGVFVYTTVRAGRLTGEVSVPIRRDRAREGVEAITMRLRSGDTVATRTIYVTRSR